MSASKSEVKNHLTTNNVEHLTSPLIFTDESVHSTDSDITNDASINAKETHQNSLSNPEVDELADQLGALDCSKHLLDQQESNSKHIQHDNYAQIPHEQDTTMEHTKSHTLSSSDSATNNENPSSENSPLIGTHEYPPHIITIVEQQESLPQNSPYETIENRSFYKLPSGESVTVEGIKQLLQELTAENTVYAYDVPHTITIIKDPYVHDTHSDSNIASNEHIMGTEPIFTVENDHVQTTPMEPTHFSPIKNHYYDFQVMDSNVDSEPPITYETNDELSESQLIMDENGEYIEMHAGQTIVSDEYYPNISDIYESNVLHEEYNYN
ncbi:unnamed protein product [Rotaria socialis]|uniref:Uncharacterized protein n=5 Tax=Rotaria socialis TaxID=392032 RepID=A0A818XTQ8_9BILA|nr:unnamed protein product [Rotaria socialis]CAF3741209.1 unnamed protein product [Rotaria socialis]CAF4303939.1 unnamed protein product [Rotaria socialis]